MVAKNFRPERTVKFMAYAAEEIGLVGSNAIAADFRARAVNVVGVLQLDMTNYKSADSTVDIAVITDYTNAAQNQFLRELILTYQPSLVFANASCGYSCSDHASWTNKGFPASFPFEPRSNPTIHTTSDTLAQSGNNANHAVKYANLALSYVGELAKGTSGSTTSTPTPINSPTPKPSPTNTPVPTPTPFVRTNVALSTNGGTASASSQFSDGYSPTLAINGARTWATGGGWKDATPNAFPDFLQVDFSGAKTIGEIDVFAVTDDYTNPAEPTENTTFSIYGITSFEVQYWNGSSWITVPNGSITNTNKVLTRLVFPAVTTTKIKIVVNNAQASYSRVVELEAWTGSLTVTPTPTPTPTPAINPTPTSTPTVNPTPTATPVTTPTPNTTPTPSIRTNVALASNGGFASASSQQSNGAASIAIDGIRNWATSGAWKDATPNAFPDFLQVDFSGAKTIGEIDVFAVKDDYTNPTDPTEYETFTSYGITSFEVQYWNGSSWAAVPGGSVVNTNRVITKLVFGAITTSRIRVVVNSGQASYSRIVELEAWTDSGTVTSTPTPTPVARANVALASNGGFASASSQQSNGAASIAIDGIRNWATSGAWKDATPDAFPDVLQVDFNGSKTINEIDVYAVKDDYSNPTDPTEYETFTTYGITSFNVQYWDGSNWLTVPNGNIVNTNKVVTKLVFSAVMTTKIRVVINSARANYSRIVELEAWSAVGNNETQISALNLHNSKDVIQALIEAQPGVFNYLKAD